MAKTVIYINLAIAVFPKRDELHLGQQVHCRHHMQRAAERTNGELSGNVWRKHTYLVGYSEVSETRQEKYQSVIFILP